MLTSEPGPWTGLFFVETTPGAVAQVLHEVGYELEEVPTRPHPAHPRTFERARPTEIALALPYLAAGTDKEKDTLD